MPLFRTDLLPLGATRTTLPSETGNTWPCSKCSVSTKEEIKFFMRFVSMKKTGFCSRLE